MKKFITLLLATAVAVGCLASCKKEQDVDDADAVAHQSTESVYDKIGAGFTIDKVVEGEDGLAHATVGGVTYELGMDFLSMAMVYNCAVPAGSTKYHSQDDVYNEWWKLYIQRWNYLMPEVPLYSNQYFDLYNAKFEGFVTSPYWAAADAIVATKVKSGNPNSAILGSSTDLSGAFRSASWGKASPGSADLDVQNLTSGHSTMMTDMSGAYVWNENVIDDEPVSVVNADGTLTYTIKIKSGLKFSDDSAITAKNYIAGILANSTPVSVAAGGTGTSGTTLVGYKNFKAYEGTGDTVYFKGVQLIDDYTFAVTYTADYAGYYYAKTYAAFSPDPLALYLGEGDIVKNANNECGLNAKFYEKNGDGKYVQADKIKANLAWNSSLPYSGPYVVSDYNATSRTATLTRNPKYPGDVRGVASIDTITYIKTESETQMSKFQKGEVDVIAGITGGDDTKQALKLVQDSPTKYAETHYDRAGYGKLGFRADFGPTGMVEVRQAIAYTINRTQFAQDFTGGYGSVVHGPYYTGYSAYQAVKNTIKLNDYAYSKDSAIEVLEAAGWVYDEDGDEFKQNKKGTNVRYKKLSGYELTKDNLHFASVDGKYMTKKIDGEYYMPLVINWFGTQPNNVTDLLITAWQESNTATKDLGMYITYTSTDFNTGLAELEHSVEDGYSGVARLNAINFATGFTSSIYDYAFNWSINPDYAAYSVCYLFDEADYAENYHA